VSKYTQRSSQVHTAAPKSQRRIDEQRAGPHTCPFERQHNSASTSSCVLQYEKQSSQIRQRVRPSQTYGLEEDLPSLSSGHENSNRAVAQYAMFAIVETLLDDVYVAQLCRIAVSKQDPTLFEGNFIALLADYFSNVRLDFSMSVTSLTSTSSASTNDLRGRLMVLSTNNRILYVVRMWYVVGLWIEALRRYRSRVIQMVLDRVNSQASGFAMVQRDIQMAAPSGTLHTTFGVDYSSAEPEISVIFLLNGDAFWKLRENFRRLLFSEDEFPLIQDKTPNALIGFA
jgi:hypothetical protein